MIGRAAKPAKLPRLRSKDAGLQRFADSLVDLLELREGSRNRDSLDAFISRRELIEVGIALPRDRAQGAPLRPAVPSAPSGLPPFMGVPPAIEGLEASGAVQSVILTWQNPNAVYLNHSYVEVWRAAVNDLGTAVLIGQSGGTMYGDPVGPGVSRYYWVRSISQSDVQGPFNAVAGTLAETGVDTAYILIQLDEQIREDQLFASLSARIDLIDAPSSVVGSVNRRVQDTQSVLQAEIDTINATLADIEATPAFDSAVSYAIGDLVKYLGALYRCIQATTAPSPLPTDAAYWGKIGDYASLGDAVAAHAAQLVDHETRVTDNEGDITAQATSFNTLQAAVNDPSTGLATKASTTQLNTAVSNIYGAAVASFTNINARFTSVEAGLASKASSTDLTTAIAGVYAADVSSFTQINAAFGTLQLDVNTRATVTQLNTAVATAEGNAVATATSQVYTTLGGNQATVQTKATSWDGVVAHWEVKTQVGQLVAGAGLLNDGQKTRFYIQADSFAVYGTTVPTNRQDAIPFNVVGGVTYIKTAAIQDASITSAKIQSLAADKIVANSLAAISANLGAITGGSLNINNRFIVTGTGVTTIKSALTGARLELSGDQINVYDSSNNLRVRLGRL